MKIIEQFSESKSGDPSKNEDVIVVTPNFVGVFDGSSLGENEFFKLPQQDKVTAGRFMAMTLADGLKNLFATTQASSAIRFLSDYTKNALYHAATDVGIDPLKSRAASCAVIYSRARKEVWHVGDSPFAIDGKSFFWTLPPAELRTQLRQFYLRMALACGANQTQLLANDPSQNKLASALDGGKIFANSTDPVFGYGVINGTPVPDQHLHVVSAKHAQEIILASDGYPKIYSSLKKTEAYLTKQNKLDPLCYRTNPGPKGVRPNNVSFDDRSYIRFTP